MPAVLGMFIGAPLVAREIETGTGQFAWTQGVTRRRWLAVKVGWLLLAALAWGGAVAALVTWWSGPKNAAYLNAFSPGRFDVQGIMPAAYSLFAMALGIAAGTLIRRVAARARRHPRRLLRGPAGSLHGLDPPALHDPGDHHVRRSPRTGLPAQGRVLAARDRASAARTGRCRLPNSDGIAIVG